MSKKTIVLADNSYTIRRIVELSFSEEEDIDLVSFENSTNLREKLLELRPAIVLVDIKLPEFNGYEVCKFVNSTESLRHTRVFLLKGGFEPVDENLLKGLRFVDIITKPFDSNALVSTIKNLLREMTIGTPPAGLEDMPPSIPEDLAEVENLVESDEEISFSDVKDDIEPGDLLSEAAAGPARGPSIYPDDEVLPSEEITQAQGEPPDTLAPSFTSAEDVDNPFQDEIPTAKQATGGLYDEEFSIKQNIELEEQDLQIGSLTEEEMDIKKRIGARERELFQQNMADDEFKVSDEEMSAVDDMFSFAPGRKEKEVALQDIPDLKPAEIEKEMGLDSDFEEPPAPASSNIRMPHVDTQPEVEVEEEVESELEVGPGTSEFDDLYQPPSPFDEKPGAKISSLQEEMVYRPPVEPMELEEPAEIGVPDVEIPDYNSFGSDNELDVETGPPVMEYEIPAPPPPPPPPRVTRPVPPMPPAPPPPSRPAAFTPPAPPKQSLRPTPPPRPMPPTAPKAPTPPSPTPPAAPPKQAVRPTPPPPPPPAPPSQPRPTEVAKPFVGKEKIRPTEEAPKTGKEIPAMANEQVLSKVEDKLATAVKEMLWEIVPPLAEKIIKEEIEKIKTDVSKSFK